MLTGHSSIVILRFAVSATNPDTIYPDFCRNLAESSSGRRRRIWTCLRDGMKENAKADDLERRLIRFGVNVMALVGRLPKTAQAKHIASQILRSGTAAAPNYAEARGAESRADFIHKLRIALKRIERNIDLATRYSGRLRD